MMTYEFKIQPEREIGVHLGPGTIFLEELKKYKEKGIDCKYQINGEFYSFEDGISPIIGASSETDITMLIETPLTEEQKQEIKQEFQSAITFNF